MSVRACVLAVVLVLLGASSMFAQSNPTNKNVYLVGAAAGSIYAGSNNYNLAMNREGNTELGAPVSICAGTPGGATTASSGGTNSTFNVGDVFQIEYTMVGGTTVDPVLFTTGTLGSANLFVSQNGTGQSVAATATAAMVQPAVQAGATVIPAPKAFVTITITQAPVGAGAATASSGINCIMVQGIRFNLGHTVVSPTTGDTGVVAGSSILAVVTEPNLNGTAVAAAVPLNLLPNTDATALAGNTFGGVNGGFPSVATNVVGSAYATLGAGGAVGIANGTGTITGGSPTGGPVATATTKSGLTSVGPGLQVGGTAKSGTVSVQEGVIPPSVSPAGALCNNVACAAASTINLPILDGGALFRGFVASGPDATSWLNSSGATTGTQVTLTVGGMPAGSSVVFPSSVTSATSGVVWTMTGGGTVSAPGGTVVYSTTVNEGPATTLGAIGTSVGPSMDIPFTVTPGSSATFGAGATVIIAVTPASGASAVPTYSQINGAVGAATGTVVPSNVVGTTPVTLFTVSTNQTTRTFPYVTFTGGTTSSDYDTGLVLTNTGRTASVVSGSPCYTVPAGGTVPAGCGAPFGGTVSATGTNFGQDGPFTIFLMSSGTTVASIRSTASNFPNASTYLTSSGNLVQGSSYIALLSQITAAAGITGKWSGELIIVSDFPSSSGFAFISQFTNPGGGSTMGYKVTAVTGEN